MNAGLGKIAAILFITVVVGWPGAVASFAADYYVRPPGTTMTDASPYDSWETAATQIQWAVNVAMTNVPATVWVTNGSYRLTNQVTITTNIFLRSVSGWTSTLVYADWPAYTTRCFYVCGSGVVDGFTISNGHYMISNDYAGGGGAYISNGTVQNCYFLLNVCSNIGKSSGGGGVFVNNGTVSNCMFFTNVDIGSAAQKGGGAIYMLPNAYVLNCQIVSNWARQQGGGIFAYRANYDEAFRYILISNCTVSFNSAPNVSGGGIHLFGAASGESAATDLTITDCLISDNNSGYSGAGITCIGGRIMNSTIVKNRNTGNGGGAVALSAPGMMSNCNISGNNCCGIYYAGTYDNNGNAIIEGCIISNNINTMPGYPGLGLIAVAGGVGINTRKGILRNCLIHNNTNRQAGAAYVCAGGVSMTNSTISQTDSGVINCTIVDNYTTNEGGGITVSGTNNYIANCVIAGNSSSSGNYPNVYYKDSVDANKSNIYYSCIITTDAWLLAEGQGNITNNPVFVEGIANYRLSAGSPCVNAGTNMDWMGGASDLDGSPRIRYKTVDMGAYECVYNGTFYTFH